jgi:hypothetical protein
MNDAQILTSQNSSSVIYDRVGIACDPGTSFLQVDLSKLAEFFNVS